jgi:hypothetical protein
MSAELMEQKLAELQQRVEQLEAREYSSQGPTNGSWQDVIGFAKGDDLFRKAMDLGEVLREQANQDEH